MFVLLSKEGRRGFVFLSRQVRSLTFAGASPFLGVLEMSTVLLLCLMPILEICGKLDLKHGKNEICWKCGSETWKSMRNCSLIKSSSSGWRGRTVGHKWLLGVAGCTDNTVWEVHCGNAQHCVVNSLWQCSALCGSCTVRLLGSVVMWNKQLANQHWWRETNCHFCSFNWSLLLFHLFTLYHFSSPVISPNVILQ